MDLLRGLVLPEYSIEWLTCAIASRLDAVMVGCRVLLKIVYLLTCRVLGVAVRPGASQPRESDLGNSRDLLFVVLTNY
jgi:hypothetical protein